MERLTSSNKGYNYVTIKSKEDNLTDINTSPLIKFGNQNIEVQEISNLLNNFNILLPNSTMDQEKLAELGAGQSIIADGITDFLDEKDLEYVICEIEDIYFCISRIEQL